MLSPLHETAEEKEEGSFSARIQKTEEEDRECTKDLGYEALFSDPFSLLPSPS